MRGCPICQTDLSTAVGVAAARVITLQLLAPAERREPAHAPLGVAWDATLDQARIVPLDTGTSAVGEPR
jgi:hypothetical protein